MKWFKENYKLVGFVLGVFTIIFAMGAFAQQVKSNKETISRILINLEKLPTPEELEALDAKLETLNVKLEFIIEMMKEQHKTIIGRFEQLEKRIERLESKSDKQ